MDSLESFYKEYFKYLPNEFDNAYILHANSGEAYCFLAYLAKACLKKDGAEKPLFVATKGYHEDIIEIFKHEDRRFAGKTAPACGLYLRNVFY